MGCLTGILEFVLIIVLNNITFGAANKYEGLKTWFISINKLTLGINVTDKVIATCGIQVLRVPEFGLHLCTLLGGTPATAAAMLLFCHKSRKTSYQSTYLNMCCLQVCILIYAIYSIIKK